MSGAYYNDNDAQACEWLRELIKHGHIAPGEVDDRSIWDVKPDDVRGFDQVHLFAGIGGWSAALRLAGVPDTRRLWTLSCPCQPFSEAGSGGGLADERHLWPAADWLIGQCCPGELLGEQVEAAIRYGWIDLVRSDLEAKNYAIAAVGLPAASVGAPHKRQRLWFVANRDGERFARRSGSDRRANQPGQQASRWADAGGRGELRALLQQFGVALGDAECEGLALVGGQPGMAGATDGAWPRASAVGAGVHPGIGGLGRDPGRRCERRGDEPAHGESVQANPWASAVWIDCRDGKRRPIEPRIFPLASGVRNRVGLLRGSGNSIVPQVAAAFIQEYMNVRETLRP